MLGDLADILIDCEPGISHNYSALQALCNDYKDKEFGEAKIAETLVKLANSAVKIEEKHTKSSLSAANLYFQIQKPCKYPLIT